MPLSSADVTRYSRDGFLSPNPALTAAQAATCREQLAAFERAIGGPLTADQTARHRLRAHVLLTWMHALVSHPAIFDAVESIVGPNILVYTSTWFIKKPCGGSQAIVPMSPGASGPLECSHRSSERPSSRASATILSRVERV